MNAPTPDSALPDPIRVLFQQLLRRYERERHAHGEPVEIDPFEYRVSPLCYPGLRSFDPTEDSVFFGRERNIKEIRNKLESQRMVVVQGGSGSGKSSVVRAGLIPRLRDAGKIEGRSGSWYAAEFRPRRDPIGNLAEGLAKMIEREFPGQPAADPNLGDGNVLGAVTPLGHPQQRIREEVARRLKQSFNEAIENIEGEKTRTSRAEALLRVLIDFTREVDSRDKVARRGLQAGPANLLILVDQFEEVFRPEAQSSGTQLLDLLILAHALLTGSEKGEAHDLFIVITMRTEELHRVGEYPSLRLPADYVTQDRRVLGLADVVNSSFYLIQVMDPDLDRDDLRAAIISPARQVLDEYQLLDTVADYSDAPFDNHVVDWLLTGTAVWRDSAGQNHRADQLPLLQHALRAMWETALERWQFAIEKGERPVPLITKQDLPRPTNAKSGTDADVAQCLDARADWAQAMAAKRFGEVAGTPAGDTSAADAALRGTIRSLARRDDRGNWARRFASLDLIDEFMKIDPSLMSLSSEKRRESLAAALRVMIDEGYLAHDLTNEYDISHEALIRNWKTALDWLREPTDTALAIERVLKDVDPERIGEPEYDGAIEEIIPSQLADRLAPVAGAPTRTDGAGSVVSLPDVWSKEQIGQLTGTSAERGAWGSVDQALQKIREGRRQAIDARERMAARANRIRQRITMALGAVGGMVILTCLLSWTYTTNQVAVAGLWAIGVAGFATSDLAQSSDERAKIRSVWRAFDYLPHSWTDHKFTDNSGAIEHGREYLDYGARFAMGSILTPVANLTSVTTETSRREAKPGDEPGASQPICWTAKGPESDHSNIQLGGTGYDAILNVNAGKATLTAHRHDDTAVLGDVTWDETALYLQDISKLPHDARICVSKAGSTLAITTPSSPVLAYNLLFREVLDKSGKTSRMVMRAQQVTDRSRFSPDPKGLLPCIRRIEERPRDGTVITRILYDRVMDGGDCPSRAEEPKLSAGLQFARGFAVPIAHALRPPGAILLDCEHNEESNPSPATRWIWSCGKATAGRQVIVTLSTVPAGGPPELRLSDDRDYELSGGPIQIDDAVVHFQKSDAPLAEAGKTGLVGDKASHKIGTARAEDLPLRFIWLACYRNEKSVDHADDFISVILQGKGQQYWEYAVGYVGIRNLLEEFVSDARRKAELPNDPTDIIGEHVHDTLLGSLGDSWNHIRDAVISGPAFVMNWLSWPMQSHPAPICAQSTTAPMQSDQTSAIFTARDAVRSVDPPATKITAVHEVSKPYQ